MTLRVVRDGRVGCATTNRVDDEGLAAAAGRAAEAADSSRPTRASQASRSRRVPIVEGYDEATAALSPEDQAEAAAAADRRRTRPRALRLLHERRHRDRRRVDRLPSPRR